MSALSRRSFMGRASAFCLYGAAHSAVAATKRREEHALTLNVVLHGLFLMNFKDSCIELLTPFVDEHIYRGDNWDRKAEDLRPGKRYRLSGTDPISTPPSIDAGRNPVLYHDCLDFDVDSDKSHLVIQLPFPAAIHSLRLVDDPPDKCTGPASCTDSTINVYTLSLCQALVYPVADHKDLELVNSPWKPRVDQSTGTASLHIWAEPETRQTQVHATKAYAKLSDLIPPLQMVLGTDKTAPVDSDAGVCGLSSEEEQGWAEWETGGEGSHPTNCCVVMVQQSSPQKLDLMKKKLR